MIRIQFLLLWPVLFMLCQPLWSKEPVQSEMAANMALPDSSLIFPPPKPVLSAQDEKALQLSVTAANAPRFPVQEAGRTLHLYGGGRPTLICSPLKLCMVELQDGERVVKNGIHLGDTVRWKVTPTVGEGKKTFLVIKPTGSGLESNLVIITDRHSYDVRLVSHPGARISRLAWSYPDETQSAWQTYYADQDKGEDVAATSVVSGVAGKSGSGQIDERADVQHGTGLLSELDFHYRISGCQSCNWRPVRVYNNGEQTVIELPDLRGKEAPAFLVKGQDEARMVNYRVLGNRYVVDQVFDQAVLVLGVGKSQQQVEIQRTAAPVTAGRHDKEITRLVRTESTTKQIQYYVQLLDAVDQPSAGSHQKTLRDMGYRVELQAMYGQAQPALRVGPWRNRDGADAALKLLRKRYQRASLWEESS